VEVDEIEAYQRRRAVRRDLFTNGDNGIFIVSVRYKNRQTFSVQMALRLEQYFLHSRKKRLSDLNSALASAEYCPCFQLPLFERACPFWVRGPVLAPPCMRHLFLLRMAGERHLVPFLVFAPQRGAILGSPGGLPFLSHPRAFTSLFISI